MSKIQRMFSANGRALLPDEIPLVESFNAEYVGALNREDAAALAQTSAQANQDVPPLLPLSAFHDAQTNLCWRALAAPAVLSLREGERLVLQFQHANVPLGHQLWREEELGRQGVFAAEEDARQFAQAIVEALGDHLSICDLEHLAAAFAAKLASEHAFRQAAIAEHAATCAAPDSTSTSRG